MRRQKGFSLIELLIVVAIILIIAAIAIPNVVKAKIAANDAAAAATIRTIVSQEMNYGTSHPDTGFVDLSTLGSSGLVDTAIGQNNAVKSGYVFNVTPSGNNNSQFVAEAHPTSIGTSGVRSFCATEDGVIKYDQSGTTFDRAACTASTKILQ